MIKLYNSDRETVIKVLNPTQSIVTRQLMGGWSMEMFHPFNEAGALIERGLYIECSTPKGLQKFKVRMVTKISENTIRVTAFHRFYDLCNNYVRDTNIVGKNRQQATSQILSNTLRPTSFTVEGHSTATNNLRIVGLDPFTAIVGNQDNSVINRYGGEWDCDNDKIIVEDYIGNDRGYLVAWDKNMTELNESIDDTGLITQIIPVGRERLMLPEVTVDSVYINSYEDIYTREIAFSDIGVDEDNNIDEAEAQRLLRLAAEKYFRETECDILKANYEVSIKDIKNNPKYEECSFFYALDIGDFVTVLKNNGLRIKVRLLEYQYDSIKEEFISFKLNALGKKLTSNTTGIQGALDKILNTNGSLNSEKLEGLINMLTVSMGAMVDSAEKHRAKAILFEDRIPSSPTYGAMAVGTKGFMIASEFDATKQDWKWRTFGTGKGFVADLIIAGIIKGAGDNLVLNLDNGSVSFKKGLIQGLNSSWNLDSGKVDFRGGRLGNSNLVIDLDNENIKFTKGLIQGSNSSWNLDTGVISFKKGLIQGLNSSWNLDTGEFALGGSGNTASHTKDYSRWSHYADGYTEVNSEGFRRNGRPYHSLIEIGTAIVGGSAGAVPREVTIQLPELWKGREFRVVVQMVDTQGGIEREWVKRVYLKVTNVNTGLGTFTVRGYWTSITSTFSENEKELQFSYIAIGG